MSLRLRLFLLFGGLLALLVLAQWWWVRVLTRDLSSEIDDVASSVGHSVMAFFHDVDDSGVARRKVFECRGEGCADATFLDEDALVHSGDKDGDEGGVAMPERRPLVERFRRGETEAGGGQDAGFEYSYRTDFRLPESPQGSPSEAPEARVKTHIKLHVEHEGGAPYLRLDGPSIERRVRIPQGFRDQLERLSRRLFLGSAGFLALGLVLAAALAHGVTAPLRQLSDAARRLGEGALGTRVPVAASGEVGEALTAFNRMSGRLEELDRRNRELSARKHLGEIGELSRGLAHTLRNPLNALGLSVEELAARGDGTAATGCARQRPELAESARRQIRRIDASLKSFLALASQSGGALAEVDLGELVEDVALEALQDSRGKARLELGSLAGLPRLRAVEPELRAVLQALVVNAIEAGPEGGRVTVRGSATRHSVGPPSGRYSVGPLSGRYSVGPPSGRYSVGPPSGRHSVGPPSGRYSVGPPSGELNRWRLEIDDEGPGLPPQIRERLFTPHLSTKANGSGMGLFLAHRIATSRYRGSLELIDLEGADGSVRGTRAILELSDRRQTGDGDG